LRNVGADQMLTAAGPSSIIGSGSMLARTALELAERHSITRGIDGEPWCLSCWSPWPCGPAQHAREVCNAAGVDLPTPGIRYGATGLGGSPRAAY
jgi:hypothetical protein